MGARSIGGANFSREFVLYTMSMVSLVYVTDGAAARVYIAIVIIILSRAVGHQRRFVNEPFTVKPSVCNTPVDC